MRDGWFRRGAVALGLVWVILSAPGLAIAAVQVEASVDTAVVTIGDPITYRLLITYDAGDSVRVPPRGVQLYGFRVLRHATIASRETSDGRLQQGDVFRIAAYRPGRYVIPPVPVEYRIASGARGELVTQPLVIEIRSLGVGEADTLRDIKAPVSLPARVRRWVWFALGALAALGAGVAAFLFWRKRREQHAAEPASRREVVDELGQFDLIPAAELIARGEVKQLYVLVSDTMRRYLARRYRVNAPELTHEELSAAFALCNIAPDEAELFLTFLARCGLVKFAKFIPTSDEVATLIDRAKDIVRQTALAAVAEVAEGVGTEPVAEAGEDSVADGRATSGGGATR